ncbi:MAG: DUF4445 domain-containing protein [Verrucomicrobia bacterium]|nr:DUF4445 domain-containing protein [Verrucomicrobiota bacterium]
MPIQLTIQSTHGSKTQTLAVTEGEKRVLTDVLAANGIQLNTRCGKRGACRGCMVELVRGSVNGPLGLIEAPAEIRTCQARLLPIGDVAVRIPAHARLEAKPQVGDSFVINTAVALEPLWPVSDGKLDTAFAVDVGTTTVVVAIIDLAKGEVLARAGDFNAQIRFGDNVITRIVAAATPLAREQMRLAMLQETIAPLLAKACRDAGRDPTRLAGGILAGNTTMLHLLTGEDPAGLGVVPFTPKFIESRTMTAAELGLARVSTNAALRNDVPMVLLPGFSAYVGADLVAGIYATGMMNDEKPSLLVDIGTNGEIVLQADGKLYCCATAAGPAFEGSGLLAGTRAQLGAISHLKLAGGEQFGFELETIGGGDPLSAPGLCGTAYVDFLATARRAGLLLPSGRFNPKEWQRLPVDLRTKTPGGFTLKIAGNLCINEADIASLIQAKAAIGAGIEILLRAAHLRAADIGTLYLAGGFGLYIDVEHAIDIGLLPGFMREQVKVMGNTSLGGATLAALDRCALPEMIAWRKSAQIFELNAQPGFEDCYLDHLSLP